MPRSLAALFPGVPRRLERAGRTTWPASSGGSTSATRACGTACASRVRACAHINAFVDGQPATLTTRVGPDAWCTSSPRSRAAAGEVRCRRRSALDARRAACTLETVEQWRAWLEEHHTRPEGVWLVHWKARTGKPAIPYEEAISEALCFGWVDSTYRSIDEERGMLWWSPRRKGSLWARTNKERVARLEAEGRMTPAGRAAVEAAKADGSWTILEPVEDLIVPDDLAAAFDARPGAREHWESFPPTAQRAYLLWVVTARRPETRARRVTESADLIAQGRRFEQR